MLPSPYQQPYQQLKQNIEALQEKLETAADASSLKTAIADLQNYFQVHIWSLELANLESKLEHQIQSINVEIDKQLRLLNMDILFLQSARQENTIKQRKQQIHNRLFLLIQYCDGALSEE